MRLIGSYSEKLAKKEAYNRNRGIARLRKAYKSGHITKQQVNKREYNKLLEISKGIEVSISEEKIAEDCKWDGLKGYIIYFECAPLFHNVLNLHILLFLWANTS